MTVRNYRKKGLLHRPKLRIVNSKIELLMHLSHTSDFFDLVIKSQFEGDPYCHL